MDYNITFEQSLLLNFFSSKIYFVFENEEEVESFLSYIKIYDNRFDENFKRKKDMKSAAWMYCNSGHRHQLEWMDEAERFYKKYETIPVYYSLARKEADRYSKAFGILKPAFEAVANMSGDN